MVTPPRFKLINNELKNTSANHIAIIMDGNGRWAKSNSKTRLSGHKKGVDTVREIINCSKDIGVQSLTLYTFSNENWFRPKTEVSSLMKLFVTTLNKEIKLLLDNNIRFKVIGDKNKLDFGKLVPNTKISNPGVLFPRIEE